MTQVIKYADGKRLVVIYDEPEAECELCHATAELRPYGPNGENICHPCGQKNPELTSKRMAQRLLGEQLDS